MKTNVGSLDKIVRIVAGIGLLALFFILEGNLRFIGLIGIVPIATALMGWCPLYSILGLSTCPLKHKES
ncbi:MAG TPA: DUF2892 domain-containing protein [Burkholderiales bacterium]|nr:DUF2892 domain-containing protein [Burkholderiales bacterium]